MIEYLRIDDIVKQNAVPVPQVQQYGCCFMCLLFFAQSETDKALKAQDVATIYHQILELNDDSIMNSNCWCGSNEHIIIDKAFQFLGDNRRMRQVGYVEPATGKVISWAGKELAKSTEGFNIRLERSTLSNGQTGKHFTAQNDLGGEYDPWDVQRAGKLPIVALNRQFAYQFVG